MGKIFCASVPTYGCTCITTTDMSTLVKTNCLFVYTSIHYDLFVMKYFTYW